MQFPPHEDLTPSNIRGLDEILLGGFMKQGFYLVQALSVFKRRTGPHERTIRQLTIDASGVRVGEPLSRFRGVMTGVPQYDALPRARSETASEGAG